MTKMEKAIRATAKLYTMRDTARRFYKEQWPAKVAEWQPIVEACMKKHGINELEAGMMLAKDLGDNGFSIIILMATVCEMVEPNA